MHDVLPIANLEPGVSGRNSLPLPGTPGPLDPGLDPGLSTTVVSLGRLGRLFGPPGVTLIAFVVLLGSPWTHFFDFGVDLSDIFS